MPITTFADGDVITAASHNANFALCVLTDTARTISVTHPWSARQTMAGLDVTAASEITVNATDTYVAATSSTFNRLLSLSNDTDATGRNGLLSFGNATGCEFLVGYVQNASAYADFVFVGYDGTYHENARLTAAGALTVKAGLTVTTGGLTVSASGITVTGNSTIAGSLGSVTALTMDQTTADTAIITLSSTGDVAHDMTSSVGTAVFGSFSKAQADSGGLSIAGFKDADGVSGSALVLAGNLGEAADTAKTTSALGIIAMDAAIKNGTGTGVSGADSNLIVVRDGGGSTRFIFDVEGTFHADVSSTTF